MLWRAHDFNFMTKMTRYRERISKRAINILKEYGKDISFLTYKQQKFIKNLKYQLKLTGRLWITKTQLDFLKSLILPTEFNYSDEFDDVTGWEGFEGD